MGENVNKKLWQIDICSKVLNDWFQTCSISDLNEMFLLLFQEVKLKIMENQLLRTSTKSNTVFVKDTGDRLKEDEVMPVANLRSQKQVLTHEDQQDLFKRVLAFLKEFFSNQSFKKKVDVNLHRKTAKIVKGESKENEGIVVSFKKMNMGSKICFEGEVKRKESPVKQGRGRAANKKISIFIMQEDYSSDTDSMFSDSLLSINSTKTMRSIDIPQMEMNTQLIAQIFQTPQPFLINLSLCLMMRYSLACKRNVCFEDSAWLLSVSTIVAYKLYYDEEIEGLMDCFMEIMKIERKDLIDLERCFLQEIQYNTVIYSQDYHFILSTLLALPIQ